MSTIALTGVLDDGLPSSPLVPPNPRVVIRMVMGQDVVVVCDVVDNAGVTVDIDADGAAELLLTVRPASSPYSPALVKAVGAPAVPNIRGRRVFTIPASATKPAKLPYGAGRYTYDIWLTFRGLRNPVVPLSPFVIGPADAFP